MKIVGDKSNYLVIKCKCGKEITHTKHGNNKVKCNGCGLVGELARKQPYQENVQEYTLTTTGYMTEKGFEPICNSTRKYISQD